MPWLSAAIENCPAAAGRTSAKRPRSVVASRDITRVSWAQIADLVCSRLRIRDGRQYPGG
jgi:hypothetical protein